MKWTTNIETMHYSTLKNLAWSSFRNSIINAQRSQQCNKPSWQNATIRLMSKDSETVSPLSITSKNKSLTESENPVSTISEVPNEHEQCSNS